ncbi:hypothetical protein TRICI_004018 [Trichomonascus ciferrii]|uniref:Myb-like domain-containing protein n=1 Tax=Trichomonascus ciferrii TaxID=44093 RepID=A0A642V211_9ASCO|nr:hypothetical protein TRICI_004018 [Trichomonascus ciferrii]
MNINQILNRASSSDSDDNDRTKKKKHDEAVSQPPPSKQQQQQYQQQRPSSQPSAAAGKKRVKAPNSTWTLEDDAKLVDLVLSTLPRQDFAEYARILNKRDSQTVRYRWKVIVRRAKGADGSDYSTNN